MSGKRSPYDIDRYAGRPARSGGVRGAFSRAAGMIGCLVTMAVLCLGMLFLLWKASGK